MKKAIVFLSAVVLICLATFVVILWAWPDKSTTFKGSADQFINRDAEMLERKIGVKLRYVGPFSNGYAIYYLADSSKLAGYIDRKYNVVIQPEYDLAWDFDENGYALVQKNGVMALINTAGKEIISTKARITNLWPPNVDQICVAKTSDGKWGAIDFSETWVIDPKQQSSDDVLRLLEEKGQTPLRAEKGSDPNDGGQEKGSDPIEGEEKEDAP